MSVPLHRQPPFALFWTSRVFGSLAFQMASVAFGWLIYDMTGSAYQLGFAGLAQFLPMVLLTFVVGAVADRWDRRRIVMISQWVQALTIGALTVGALQGWLGVNGLFAGLAILGAARTFERPAMAALLPSLVSARELPRAVALSSSAMQTATIVGPSLGGLLHALGAAVPLGLSAALFALGALAMAPVRLRTPPAPREPMTWRAAFSGLGFVRRKPVLLGAISLDMVAVLLGGVTALLPIFAKDILETGPWGLGVLRTAPAIGALAMAMVIGRLDLSRAVGAKMFVAVIVFGLCTIVFAASSHLWLSVGALVILGAADNVSVVIRQTLVQLATPDEMRGRVSALNSLFIGASNQLGEFESGMTAGLMGVVAAGILGGVGTIAVALAWMRLFPSLRHADRLDGVK
ncbi:MFS transporter [Zavarzinia compransoris]|uniref:MFS transporter n=1 Tax=Zavarzinia compransoris TaxID=1264899 RepID=UPI0010D348D2|nr:MFS transporter [Zavarzinia compransoris]TDP47899.1 putative MFS family arabinose efflux permease [Zavarzinia compransoris]